MNLNEQYQLNHAALKGAADHIEESTHATRAILDVLKCDLNGEIELNDFHRDGMLTALQQLSDSVTRRAYFALERFDEDFGGEL